MSTRNDQKTEKTMLMRSPFRKSRKEGSTLMEGVPRTEGVPPAGGISLQRGFTLVEVMIAVIIVGVGISAAMYGLTSSMTTSHEGRGILVAGILAGYVKQYSDDLAFSDPEGAGTFGAETGESGVEDYDDVDDLDGLTLAPPIGADGTVLTAFPNWSQTISVSRLDPDTFEVLAGEEDTPVLRVEVEVQDGGRRIGQYQWIVTRR